MLSLLLALGCLHQPVLPVAPPEPWFPLGNSELAPWSQRERDSWRDALLVPGAFAMDAALDRLGRIWVATVEPSDDGARIRVQVRRGEGWIEAADRAPQVNVRCHALP